MQISTTLTDKVLIVNLVGEIDHHSAAKIKEKVERDYMTTNAKDIILDFSSVTFMDSSGIGMIMGRYKNLIPKGQLKIFGANEHINNIFSISGIEKIITICKDKDEALGGRYVR
ncbi:MAG: anti-sigma factor antagonist [Defluviitaleaceae bacterium]|nr:anti-sigma factor antagonist [Defluviitaleaceae bacterium]